MALQTKTFSSTTTSNEYTLKLTVTENSTSTSDNTSSVTYRLFLESGDWNFDNTFVINWTVTLNGTQYSGTITNGISKHSTLTIATGTVNIGHNSDGTLTMSVAGTISMTKKSFTPGDMSLTGSMSLTTIPRASTMTVPSTITIGTNPTFTITKASSGFAHTIKYSFGNLSNQQIVSKTTATSYSSWTPPNSLGSQIPTATQGTITFVLETYSSSASNATLIGSKTYTSTLKVPSYTPTASLSTSLDNSANSVINGWGVAVKGFTKINYTITGSTSYGASITGYEAVIGATGETKATASGKSGVVKNTGSTTVKARVKDGRVGWSSQVSKSITVYNYSSPVVSSCTAYRCLQDGTQDSSGTYLRLYCSATLGNDSTIGGRNSLTNGITYSTSRGDSGTLTSDTALVVGNDNYSVTQTYTVTITVKDTVGTTITRTFNIPTELVTFHMKEGGKGVAFGGFAQRDNTVDFTTWEVVGKVKGLGYCPPIPSGADVDSYTTPGEYGVSSTNAASSVTHLPVTQAGRLTVFTSTGHAEYAASATWKYITQEYYTIWGVVYQRRGESGSGTAVSWGSWKLIYGVDAVIEQGTSGIWTYRKWNSGQCDLWGNANFKPTSSTAWGGIYYSDLISVSLPFTVNNGVLSGTGSDNVFWIVNAFVNPSTTAVSFRAVRPEAFSTTTSYGVRLTVHGTWK